MALEVNELRQEGVLILAIKGDLDSTTSSPFEEKLLGLIQQGESRLILHCEEMDYISSAGFRVLLKAVKELGRVNGQLCLCSIRDYIREVFDLSGFVSFMPIQATLEDSLKFVNGIQEP